MHCRFSLLALCAALPLPALSQEPYLLDEIVLSAGISPLPVDAYTRAHTIVTAAEIEARGVATVQDALRGLPGVSVSSAGNSMTAVRIRGSEANHVLILIDGIEAAGGDDSYVLSGLETADIDRIEVLRGPQSVIYGSNASAGVINIITRRGGEGFTGRGSVEAGNGGAASLFASQRGAQGGIALSLSARDDRGYDHSGDGGGRDGINRKTIALSGDIAVTPDLRFGATLRRSDERFGYDAASWMATDAAGYIVDADLFADRDEVQTGVWAEYTMLDGRLTHRLDLQQTILKQSDEGAPVRRGETRKLKYRASLSLDGQPVGQAGQMLSLLAEAQRDEHTSAPGDRRQMTSVAAEYRATVGNLDLQAGVRHDANRVFDDFTSWNLGLGWRIPDRGLRLHASAGTGLVNPSFFDLYADQDFGSVTYRGNPNLRPETNRGFDIGIEAELPGGRGLIDITYFDESLEDEIMDVLLGIEDGVARYGFANQPGRSPRKGVEVSGRLQATDDLTLGLSYTYLDAKNPDGSVEIRRPRHELGLTAALAVLDGRGQINADLRHVAGNQDTQFWGAYQTRELPTYTVVNLGAGYDLTDRVRVTGRVANVFDRDYSEVWGYASPGRTAHLGLVASW